MSTITETFAQCLWKTDCLWNHQPVNLTGFVEIGILHTDIKN